MKSTIIFPTSSVFLLLSVVLLFPASIAAQNATSDTNVASVHYSLQAVSDSSVNYFEDVEVHPGETITMEVLAVNWANEPVDIRVYTTNARSSPNGGFLAGAFGEDLTGSASWIDLPTQEVKLPGNGRSTLTFDVFVPLDTKPGQYISALVADTIDTMPIPGADVIDHRIRYAISVGILVPGDLTAEFELGLPNLIDQDLVIPISNTGNHLVRPAGELELRDGSGEVVLSSPLELGSIYAGNHTEISLGLPVQLPEDEYSLSLTLTDPESNYSASLENTPVTMAESEVMDTDPTVTVASTIIVPNDVEITYADVELVLLNDDQQLPVNVVLGVYRDGHLIEDVALATNQIFLLGENTYTARYLPADMWEPGIYTFTVSVNAVDPNGGQQIELLNEDLDAEIVVP